MNLAETFPAPIRDTRRRDPSGDTVGYVEWQNANDGRMITAIWRPTLRTVVVRTPGGVYRLDCKAHPSAPPRNVLSGIQAAFSTAFKS
jgi:hypothetical protein